MANGIVGLNILGDRAFDRNALIALVQQLQPAYVVCMNNPALAAELQTYTTVIARRHPDDNAQDFTDPIEFVRSRAPEVPKGGYLYLGNEPQASKKLNDWTVIALHAAHDLGIKCCILNMATGNPEPQDWEVLTPCIDLNNVYGGINGVHAYWMSAPNTSPSYPYHVGRYFDVAARLGGKWVVTETGGNQDKGGGIPDPYAGWLTYLSENTYADHAGILAQMHAAKNIAVCYFSYPEWDGHGFDVSQATGNLHLRWIGLNQIYKVKATAEPPPAPVVIVPDPLGIAIPAQVVTTGLRLRYAPNGEYLSTLALNEVVTLYPETKRTVSGSAYEWVFLKRGNGQQGWSAPKSLNGQVWIQPVPPPTPDVPKVKLNVPYISQSTGAATHYANDCGVASSLMLQRWKQQEQGFLAAEYPTVDEASEHTSLPIKDDGLTIAELVALLKGYGIASESKSGMTPDAVKVYLDQNQPPLVLCNYGHLNPADSFDGGHFAIVTAYSDKGFWVNDPYHGGKDFYVPRAKFEDALRDVLAFSNGSYQGLTLK